MPDSKRLLPRRNPDTTFLLTSQGDGRFEQIKTLLKVAEPPMRAMILLATNGGLGNNDLALLKVNSCDLENGWLDYPRPKTATPRRIPLWVETIKAVELAIEKPGTPKDKMDDDKLFIGKLGSSYVSTKGERRH